MDKEGAHAHLILAGQVALTPAAIIPLVLQEKPASLSLRFGLLGRLAHGCQGFTPAQDMTETHSILECSSLGSTHHELTLRLSRSIELSAVPCNLQFSGCVEWEVLDEVHLSLPGVSERNLDKPTDIPWSDIYMQKHPETGAATWSRAHISESFCFNSNTMVNWPKAYNMRHQVCHRQHICST